MKVFVRVAAGLTCTALACTALAVAGVMMGAEPASADSIRDRQYWLSDYGVSTAWATTRGEGVTIAVIDSGIDGSVADLTGQVVGGADFSGRGSADGQTPVGDDPEHGTLVASMLAGHGHGDDRGVIGVAPEARLLSASVGLGTTSTDSDSQIADAVRWSVDNGADVINMSLTRNTLDWPESWDDAFLYAFEHDVVIVAAAGNRGSGTGEVGAPATMPGVLTVAGVDENGQASFDASSQGITIAVAAPSEALIAAAPGDRYFTWSGTSGAAPLVSGAVALVMAAHPELDAANVINRIIATARPAGEPFPSPVYGFGLMDVAAAVTAAVEPVTTNPMGDLAEWVRVHRRADPVPTVSLAPSEPGEGAGDSTSSGGPAGSGDSGTDRAATGPLGVLLPTVAQLRDTGIPLLVFVVFGGLAAVLGFAAARRLRAVDRGFAVNRRVD